MKLENSTAYPSSQVRAAVAYGLGSLTSARWLTVRVLHRRSNNESSEASGEGTTGPVTITLRIEEPASAFPRDYSASGEYLPMSAETWQERLVFLAGHEANHVRLRRAGRWDDDTEGAADHAGLARLRWYRVRRLLWRRRA